MQTSQHTSWKNQSLDNMFAGNIVNFPSKRSTFSQPAWSLMHPKGLFPSAQAFFAAASVSRSRVPAAKERERVKRVVGGTSEIYSASKRREQRRKTGVPRGTLVFPRFSTASARAGHALAPFFRRDPSNPCLASLIPPLTTTDSG